MKRKETSKMNENIYSDSSITYEGRNVTCIITAEVNVEDGTKHLPSLEFWNDKDEMIDVWNWEGYLFEKVYFGTIKPDVDGVGDVNMEIYNDLRLIGISEDEFPALKEMFEMAIRLGYFNEYMRKAEICI